MRQFTCSRPNLLEWWDVPALRPQDDGDAIVQPLAVTRCDLDLYIVPTIKVVFLRKGIE